MSRNIIIFLFFICLQPTVANATTFKIATLSPEGSSWMDMMRSGAKEVAEKTNNRVKIKFYPGGVMGDDMAVMRKIRIRQLQGGAVTIGAVSNFYSDSQVYKCWIRQHPKSPLYGSSNILKVCFDDHQIVSHGSHQCDDYVEDSAQHVHHHRRRRRA